MCDLSAEDETGGHVGGAGDQAISRGPSFSDWSLPFQIVGLVGTSEDLSSQPSNLSSANLLSGSIDESNRQTDRPLTFCSHPPLAPAFRSVLSGCSSSVQRPTSRLPALSVSGVERWSGIETAVVLTRIALLLDRSP